MKKVFSIIICGAVVAGFTSCKNEEEDIFGESSALRLNHAVATYDDLLTSAENGWVMEYFANEEEQGYPMLVKFDKSGAVTFAAKNHYSSNDVYATEESLYEVIADNGPVLSFNSYNTLFHIFADPADNPETGTEDNPIDETGVGHEGDYEFVIYEGDADHFRMKGKKHGLEINMYKLPADQPWDTYYDKLDEIKNSYFSPLIETNYLSVGEERYTITGMSDGVLDFVPEGGDPISQTVTTPFIVRLDGSIHLCTPFEGEDENFSVQNFSLADDGTLVCTDEGQTAVIYGPTPLEAFADQEKIWPVTSNTFVGSMESVYDRISSEMRNFYGGTLSFLRIEYDAIEESYVLSMRTSNRFQGYLCLDVSFNEDSCSINIACDGTKGDGNGVAFYNDLASLKELVGFLSSTFSVSANSALAPTVLTFTAQNGTDAMVLEMQ